MSVLDGDSLLSDLKSAVKDCIKRHRKMFGQYDSRSLDTPIGSEDGRTLQDMIGSWDYA
jgi:hypothetical protein